MSFTVFLQNQSQKLSHSNYCNSRWLHYDAVYRVSQVPSVAAVSTAYYAYMHYICLFRSKMFSTVFIYYSAIVCLQLT